MTCADGLLHIMPVSRHTRPNSNHGALSPYIAFSEEAKAIAFERYLKSASGRAFANKRLR